MTDFTEYSEQGWLSRIMDSIKGVLVGLVLVVAGPVLLFWNEGNFVKTRQALEEGAGAVVTVEKHDAKTDKKFVHVSGDASADAELKDGEFGVAMKGIALSRKVEMFQWDEEVKTSSKKKLGGSKGTKKEYSYVQKWSETAIDSGKFQVQKNREGVSVVNPGSLPYKSQHWLAKSVTLSGYTLTSDQVKTVAKIGATKLEAKAIEAARTPSGKLKATADGFYSASGDPAKPRLGDVRVTYTATPSPVTVSVTAQQAGTSFVPFKATNGKTFAFVTAGKVTAKSVFEGAKAANETMNWILRLVGFLAIAIGFGLIFNPLVVVADVVPFIGSFIGLGVGIAAIGLAVPISLVVIAIAWLFYRPLIGVLFIVVAGAVIFGLMSMVKKRKGGGAAPEVDVSPA